MDWETFAERLTDAQSRLRNLRLHDPDTENLDSLDQAFADLATAQKELRAQMEQLVTVRRELSEQRRRYRMLFVSAPAAYFVTTREGVVLDANQQAGVLLHVRPKGLIGKTLMHYVAAAQQAEFGERLHRLETPGTSVEDWALRMRSRGGRRFEASATVVCGIEPTQHEIELQWLIVDATVRRREARALRQANAELEGRVAERTRELEDASHAKDEFLASLSHELRTPVNVIRGFARMLRSGALDPESRARAIEAIDRNAARQSRLVSDLLDVSRITAGTFSLRPRHIDLRAPLAAACDAARKFADTRQVDLRRRLPDAPAWVWGDAERLQQAFDNLLSNAIKFTPSTGLVEVDLVPEGACWRVTVRDTGMGIAPDFMTHLFERFHQADSSTNVYGGLGVGLSIVQHIVQMHGGRVTAESAGRGQGATFTCRLPVSEPRPAGTGG